MKETCYRKSALMIVKGVVQLGVSLWHTVYNHPACTALVVSMVMNVCLFVSMANAKCERDRYNYEATKAELKLDSISILIPHYEKR